MASKLSPYITVGEHSYYVHYDSKAPRLPPHLTRRLSKFDDDFIPATAIHWDKTTFTHDDLNTTCHEYQAKDDVWSSSFLSRKCCFQHLQQQLFDSIRT